MWEYKRIDISYKISIDLDEELNNLGKDGWEIIKYEEIPTERYDKRKRVKILAKKLIDEI